MRTTDLRLVSWIRVEGTREGRWQRGGKEDPVWITSGNDGVWLSQSSIAGQLYTYSNRGRSCEQLPIGQRAATHLRGQESAILCLHRPPSCFPADTVSSTLLACSKCLVLPVLARTARAQSALPNPPPSIACSPTTCHAQCDDAVMADPLTSPCRPQPRLAPPSTTGGGLAEARCGMRACVCENECLKRATVGSRLHW